jgi:hypothetical protein
MAITVNPAGEAIDAAENTQTISAGMCLSIYLPQGVIPVLDTVLKADTLRLEDEIALYDRQIRLWGVKAQEKHVTKSPV